MEQADRFANGVDADVRVLERLRELGCDSSRPRGTRHFIYAPSRERADAIAGVLERQGWETSIQEDDEIALVTASCLRVLTGPLVRETREHLTALASQHGGQYDGWEADAQ
ncbi:MAG TPA: ribonuclease E inhibitor RraB [Gaiellaceae bacterium]|nr:ribonuclease E inhibitor RraB [Gaiellaceae bacterium]